MDGVGKLRFRFWGCGVGRTRFLVGAGGGGGCADWGVQMEGKGPFGFSDRVVKG